MALRGLPCSTVVEHRRAAACRGQRQDSGLAPVAILSHQSLGEDGECGDLLRRLQNSALDPLGIKDHLNSIIVHGAHPKLLDHHVGDERQTRPDYGLQDAKPALLREMTERTGVEDKRFDGVHD
jgi:hypothetical protein